MPVTVCDILDTGSAITLLGEKEASRWLQTFPEAVKKVAPLPSSIRSIRGIGSTNHVCYWVQFTLDIGGCLVQFKDVPVLREHGGLLLGNDFLGPGRSDIKYTGDHEGTLTLFNHNNSPISLPVAFTTLRGPTPFSMLARRASKKRRHSARMAAAAAAVPGNPPSADVSIQEAVDLGEVTDEERTNRVGDEDTREEVESLLQGVTPVAWAPETIVVPSWSEKFFKVRVPATLAKCRDVLLTPLEDDRQKDLGVLIAPTLQKVDKEGYVWCRAINMGKKQVRIPLLTPVARFQVDPRVYQVDHEFTVDEILEQVNVGEELGEAELEGLKAMLATRRALFRTTLGYAHGYKMKIRMPAIEDCKAKPPNATNRVRSKEEDDALIKEVKKQWKAGLIEPCTSPYNSLPMLVKKPTKEGEPQQYRVVLDYRAVNSYLWKDVYPLPNLASNLSQLGKANWLTTCDLLAGFHQCELEDDGSKEVTAFGTPLGQFQYVRMPMGLASSPSTFMRLVDATLRGLPPGIALAYVDDICIPTCGTFEDHLRDVGMVFDKLIEAGFTVRCDKCHIGLREVPYLGFMVGAYGTRPLPEKTKVILDILASDLIGNPAACARFAGMLGFYSKFIPDLHTILAPFHDLKAKSVVTEDIIGGNGKPPSLRFLASFELAKHRLASITACARPDVTQPYYVHVDAASSCGIGAVLMQRTDPDDPDSLVPIEFWSRRLADEERGYSVRDQECLALSEALKNWRHYLLGQKVIVLSDHSSLQWLLTTSHPDGLRVSGWALNAQNFDVEINFIPGKLNVVADYLSRVAKDTKSARERGASGESRDDIADRLEQAESAEWRQQSEAAEHDFSLATHLASSELFASTASAATQQGVLLSYQAVVAELQARVCSLTAASASSVDDTEAHVPGMRTLPLPPALEPMVAYNSADDVAHRASRIALVVLNPTSDGRISMAVEQHSDITAFPSVSVESDARFHYRNQLARMVQFQYRMDWSVLRDAVPFKCRSRKGATCHYFVSVVADDSAFQANDPTSCSFIDLNDESLQGLAEKEDAEFARVIARALQVEAVDPSAAWQRWTGSFAKIRHRVSTVHSAAATVATVASTPSNTALAPTIDEKPFGPALISTVEHGRRAIRLIESRLRSNPGLSLAVDLEGMLGGPRAHIDLMQLSVDPTADGESRLVFVFDTHLQGAAFLGTGPLRRLLEDSAIPKALHCSYGDASSLYYEYGIQLKGGFDTGLADCLLRGQGLNRQRKLDKVTHDYLGDTAFLQYKESFVHVPGMFATRPLPLHYFTYAYEDVLYENRLYLRQRELLRSAGLLEVAELLSAQRAPPLSLPSSNNGYVEPKHIAISVRDSTHVLCLRRYDQFCMVSGSTDKTAEDKRFAAGSIWADVMGEAPKSLRGMIPHKMKRAVRLGDTLLFEVVVKNCAACLAELQQAEGDKVNDSDLVTVMPLRELCEQRVALPAQEGLFQYLWWQASMQKRPPPTAISDVVVGRTVEKTRGALILHDESHVYCIGTAGGVLQFPSLPVEVGGQPLDAAIKAFDLYAGPSLRKWEPLVVGLPVMPNTSARIRAAFQHVTEACVLGNTTYFSCYVPRLHELALSFWAARHPRNGFRIIPTLAKRHPSWALCIWQYAKQHLDAENDALAVPTLSLTPPLAAVELVASVPHHHPFNSSVECWQATPSGQSQNSGALRQVLLPQGISDPTLVEKVDYILNIRGVFHDDPPTAVELAYPYARNTGIPDHRHVGATIEVADPPDEAIGPTILQLLSMNTRAPRKAGKRSQSLEQRKIWLSVCIGAVESWVEDYTTVAIPMVCGDIGAELWELACTRLDDMAKRRPRVRVVVVHQCGDQDCLPPAGADVEYDSLFEAAVLLRYAALVNSPDASSFVTLGTPPPAVVKIDDVREEQAAHPATSDWVDYLRFGELSSAWQTALKEGTTAQLVGVGKDYKLNGDGLLCRISEGREQVVLPPRFRRQILEQYHDRLGHQGVLKTLELLQRRFYWGGVDIMHEAVKEHIRTCDACQRSKVPGHPAGQHQIGFCGNHPGDIWCGDVFFVGEEEDGFDHTLDFACCFSRGVRATAMQGMPTSEEIIDVLVTLIIRSFGVPSEVRSDAGSNFISKAVQLLYARMGISITVGTAYQHQLVALVERWHRTLKSLLAVHRLATKSGWGSKWYRCLPLLEFAYNTTINQSTGHSPFFLQHLRNPRMPCDLERSAEIELPKDVDSWVQDRLDDLNVTYDAAAQELRLNALTSKRKYDLRHEVGLWFKPGDQVLLVKGSVTDKRAIKAKAMVPTDGPFTIGRVLPHDRYILNDLKTRRIRDVVHVSRLIPYFKRKDEPDDTWRVGAGPTGGRWPVQSLVGRRVLTLAKPDHELGLDVGAKVLQYKVRWVGFNRDHDGWRSLQHLSEVMGLVNEYDSKHPRPIEFISLLKHVPRPDDEIPDPSSDSFKRRHFRALPNKGPKPLGDIENIVPLPVAANNKEQQEAVLHQTLQDSLQRLPPGTRVSIYHPDDGSHRTGVIRKSWLPRWRKATTSHAEHHINVLLDDPRYPDLREYNVQQWAIEVLSAPKIDKAISNPPLVPEERLARRSERLERHTRRNYQE